MPLVDHWVGIKHPFQSLSSLLSCSAGLKSLKLHHPGILAIRILCVIEIPPTEVPRYMWRESVSKQKRSAAGSVISTVIEELVFLWPC